MKVYDGTDMILGRLAAQVAKDALLGETVRVINCDKIVVSGKKVVIVNNEKVKRARKGYPLKSAKRIRLPDRHVRRVIRGMVPWKQTRGREAYKRVMCYIGVPEEFATQEKIIVKGASVKKLPNLKYITIAHLCKSVGGKER